MRMLVDIERFITSVNCSPVLRNVGGGILFMTYACFRWKQTGSMTLLSKETCSAHLVGLSLRVKDHTMVLSLKSPSGL